VSSKTFIVVGENIHCTRIYKVGGNFVKDNPAGKPSVVFGGKGDPKYLPVPDVFLKGADWAAGKVKHCGVAVWQGLYGDKAGQALAVDYLQSLARKQTDAGAAFLDVNVDEFSTDVEERVRAIRWVAGVVQKASALPLSIDSSNPAILEAGLAACEASHGQPMVNSVSLERQDAIGVAAKHRAVVVASAAGEKDLPGNTAERLANLKRLMPMLAAVSIRGGAVYVDPLVFPVATDSNNAQSFLDAVKAVRAEYGKDIHITGGLSNVSFGMPNRKLINQVFTHLAVEAGADGGIVDPLQINGRVLAGLDTASEPFRLARALLTGEDPFGAEYITAHREGRLGSE
jgi:5-methyltetrahydrofolate--homocysteine methyltransferase